MKGLLRHPPCFQKTGVDAKPLGQPRDEVIGKISALRRSFGVILGIGRGDDQPPRFADILLSLDETAGFTSFNDHVDFDIFHLGF